MRISYAIFYLICAGGGLATSYFGAPLMKDNSDAYTFVATVMTVFAGFLFAVLSLAGDPSQMGAGTWRKGEVKRDKVEARLIRGTYLFFLYLLTLVFLFVAILLTKSNEVSAEVKTWIYRTYLFIGATSFLLTFALPVFMRQSQMEIYDNAIDERRKQK